MVSGFGGSGSCGFRVCGFGFQDLVVSGFGGLGVQDLVVSGSVGLGFRIWWLQGLGLLVSGSVVEKAPQPLSQPLSQSLGHLLPAVEPKVVPHSVVGGPRADAPLCIAGPAQPQVTR